MENKGSRDGKTSDIMNVGEVLLHDVSSEALVAAKNQLRRAGIQNARFMLSGDPRLESYKGKCDWVSVFMIIDGTHIRFLSGCL